MLAVPLLLPLELLEAVEDFDVRVKGDDGEPEIVGIGAKSLGFGVGIDQRFDSLPDLDLSVRIAERCIHGENDVIWTRVPRVN